MDHKNVIPNKVAKVQYYNIELNFSPICDSYNFVAQTSIQLTLLYLFDQVE